MCIRGMWMWMCIACACLRKTCDWPMRKAHGAPAFAPGRMGLQKPARFLGCATRDGPTSLASWCRARQIHATPRRKPPSQALLSLTPASRSHRPATPSPACAKARTQQCTTKPEHNNARAQQCTTRKVVVLCKGLVRRRHMEAEAAWAQ